MKKDKIKIVLIVVVLVLIFAILLFKSIREKGEKVVSFNNKDEIVSGRDSAIDKTKFFANTQNGNAFDIGAQKIVNIDENIFQLYEISADIKLKDDKKLNITADKGKYDFNKKKKKFNFNFKKYPKKKIRYIKVENLPKNIDFNIHLLVNTFKL